MAIKPRDDPKGKIPAAKPKLTHSGVAFSFKYFAHRTPFVIEEQTGNYLLALVERLRDCATKSALELQVDRSKTFRCHTIRWEETSQSNGFDHINATLREEITPYQFSVSVNEHGRVLGFFIGDVFYVVWLDPKHQLYPRSQK